ncbi:MAG: hypothetical protein IPM57_03960 [Oligoflexia bacterium]|nr:hypothetical protein [Oligoflexia bacterium]
MTILRPTVLLFLVFLIPSFGQAQQYSGLLGLLKACMQASNSSNQENLRLENENTFFYESISSSPYLPKIRQQMSFFIRHPQLRGYGGFLFSPKALYSFVNGSDIFHINIPTGGASFHLALDIRENSAIAEFRPGLDDGAHTVISGLIIDRFEHLIKKNPFFIKLKGRFSDIDAKTVDEIPEDEMPSPYFRIQFKELKDFQAFLEMTDKWYQVSDPNRDP